MVAILTNVSPTNHRARRAQLILLKIYNYFFAKSSVEGNFPKALEEFNTFARELQELTVYLCFFLVFDCKFKSHFNANLFLEI